MKTIYEEREVIREAKTIYQCSQCEYKNEWSHHVEAHEVHTHKIPNREVDEYWLFKLQNQEEADLVRKWLYGNHPGKINTPGWYEYDNTNHKFIPIDEVIKEQEDKLIEQQEKVNLLKDIKMQ